MFAQTFFVVLCTEHAPKVLPCSLFQKRPVCISQMQAKKEGPRFFLEH